MKRYYKDGKVGTLSELFSNTSFPRTGHDSIAKERGAIPVLETIVLGDYQTTDWHDGKVVGDNYQFFTVRDKADTEVWEEVRNQRNNLLAATDLFGLSDVTMTNDMKTYRQALRDVPQNNSDPKNITWPKEPS
jgi:hypothetical protein